MSKLLKLYVPADGGMPNPDVCAFNFGYKNPSDATQNIFDSIPQGYRAMGDSKEDLNFILSLKELESVRDGTIFSNIVYTTKNLEEVDLSNSCDNCGFYESCDLTADLKLRGLINFEDEKEDIDEI
ncbi:MAG: hypothetical protein K0B02_03500 [DPANN group archaeon]|nr:hypothetical protein [DPANN group archaeon]